MDLVITTLIENMQGEDKNLSFEHGLSLFIEFEGRKILFDTGQTGAYIENAKNMMIPIENTDTMIISHGHYDHSGGVIQTLNLIHSNVKMYVGKEFFEPKFKSLEDGTFKFNGNAFSKEDVQDTHIRLKEVEDDTTFLSGNIALFKNFSQINDFEFRNPKFVVKQDDKMIPDDFADEIVLGLITRKGMVIVAGCSHVGIANILENIRQRLNIPIYAVLGGTHLVEADESRIDKTIEVLKKVGVERVAVSHCTGELGLQRIKEEFGDKFILNNTGNVFMI